LVPGTVRPGGGFQSGFAVVAQSIRGRAALPAICSSIDYETIYYYCLLVVAIWCTENSHTSHGASPRGLRFLIGFEMRDCPFNSTNRTGPEESRARYQRVSIIHQFVKEEEVNGTGTCNVCARSGR
jgi:hypothetical protein